MTDRRPVASHDRGTAVCETTATAATATAAAQFTGLDKTSDGRVQYRPAGRHAVASWDFDSETD